MRARSERGSVLAQVLVGAAIMALIAVSVLRARMQPAMVAAAAVNRVTEDLATRAALARLEEVWTRTGACSSESAAGVACSSSIGGCTCAVGAVNVAAVVSGGAYVLTTETSGGSP